MNLDVFKGLKNNLSENNEIKELIDKLSESLKINNKNKIIITITFFFNFLLWEELFLHFFQTLRGAA